MIITKRNKQPNKQKKKEKRTTKNRNRLCKKQTCICIVAAMSETMLKTEKFFIEMILFSINMMDLYLISCPFILCKKRLENVTKVFISEVFVASLKISKLLDANKYLVECYWPNVA